MNKVDHTINKAKNNKYLAPVIIAGLFVTVVLAFLTKVIDFSKYILCQDSKATKTAVVTIAGDTSLIELRIGSIKLDLDYKFVMFYSTPYPTDTVLFHSVIPLSVTSLSKRQIDSIEVGFILPPEAGIHFPDYEYEDNPNLVDRYYSENWRQISAKYVNRRLNKGYVYLIEEPIFLPISLAQIHLEEGQRYDAYLSNGVKKTEFHNLKDVSDNGGLIQISWDFRIYTTGPNLNTETYKLGICRKKAATYSELRRAAQQYLLQLGEKEQRETIALLLYNQFEAIGSFEKEVAGDLIIIPAIQDLIDLEEVRELFIDHKKKEFVERTQSANDIVRTYPLGN